MPTLICRSTWLTWLKEKVIIMSIPAHYFPRIWVWNMLLLLLVWIPAHANDYYYSAGQRIPVVIAQDQIAVVVNKGISIRLLDAQRSAFPQLSGADTAKVFLPDRVFLVPLTNSISINELRSLAFDLAELSETSNAGEVVYPLDTMEPVVMTDKFIVKFKNGVTPQQIAGMNSANAVEIVRQNQFSRNEYVLRITRNSGTNALTMANRYYENSLTEFAHPNFFLRKSIFQFSLPPNDPRFGDQQHLHNTGQGGGVVGADSDHFGAWLQLAKTNSPPVIIAIIDNAIERDHEGSRRKYLHQYARSAWRWQRRWLSRCEGCRR